MNNSATRSKTQPSGPPSIRAAPRQRRTHDAWKAFCYELQRVLGDLEEDDNLIISRKRTNRFVQFAAQGSFGMRAEATSNAYLPEQEKLSEEQNRQMLFLGWDAPTHLPDESGYNLDGSPNYYLDLAQPVPLMDLAVLATNTLANVFGAGHPGTIEYRAFSDGGGSIRFPSLGIRNAVPKE